MNKGNIAVREAEKETQRPEADHEAVLTSSTVVLYIVIKERLAVGKIEGLWD